MIEPLKLLAMTLALAIAIPVSLGLSMVHDTGSDVIRVPQDVATVQEAVAVAGPGDVVLLDRGSYPGGVVVPESKRGITIRGVDRNAVVFDGADRRDNAIVVHADGVALRNLSAHNFLENGFYWDGVRGFSGSYLTVWNVLGYGIYAEDSTDGLIERDYVSGAADAAYYVGECAPCRTTLRKLVARLSAVGYSGTNASGKLVIRDSLWDRNGAGILPNTYANEKDPPQRNALIVGNTVIRSGWARVPLHTPLAGFYGIGIGIAGGNDNRVLRNRIVDSRRFGIALFRTDYLISLDPPPKPPGTHRPWRPRGEFHPREHRPSQRNRGPCTLRRSAWRQLLPPERSRIVPPPQAPGEALQRRRWRCRCFAGPRDADPVDDRRGKTGYPSGVLQGGPGAAAATERAQLGAEFEPPFRGRFVIVERFSAVPQPIGLGRRCRAKKGGIDVDSLDHPDCRPRAGPARILRVPLGQRGI